MNGNKTDATKSAIFKPGRVAQRELGLSGDALRRFADAGLLRSYRTPGGQRRYDVSSFTDAPSEETPGNRKPANVCYCRVSTRKQQADLDRQIEHMREHYPSYEIVTDVGSGLNFKRKGLQWLLERAMRGEICEVVVAHRDRLCRFAFDLVEWIFQRHGAKLVVLHTKMESLESELAEDLMSIVHVFSARSYGHRNYGKKRKKGQDQEDQTTSGDSESDRSSAPFGGDEGGAEAVDGMS